MRLSIAILLLLFFFTFSIDLSSCSSNFQFDAELQVSADGCSGENVGECLEMSSKRILWAATTVSGGGKKRYISYETLRRDNVPCNRPGMPYYNCHALPKANPYTRDAVYSPAALEAIDSSSFTNLAFMN
ncbi:uncharacterized protein A4U43_C02F12520 [Asparagus officinalis]|uniref:Uncharacterized protein n=1 Tax=Asparagus officinalis TaxID=4686 RepID=A0A5P1FLV5_ASPOF|nr:protein RALF-like 19 [Asparagus officinalis]ONK77939.1 uncharacterized protein A4U43_C02F12520 [Asparagus officinalis]